MISKLQPVIDFLMGGSPLEGVHFGERHATKAGKFWWRLNLRAAMHEAGTAPSEQEVQEAFEQWFGGEKCVGRSPQMELAWRAAVKWMQER